MGYIDVFRDYAIFAAIAVVLALMLRRVNSTSAPAAH